MAAIRLCLLGPPRIERDGVPVHVDTRKAVALAALLALTEAPMSRETVAAMLWPEYDQVRAGANLRRTLSALKNALGGEGLLASRETLELDLGPGLWVDVAAFRQLVRQGRNRPDSGGPLAEAVALYRGDFLAGFSLRDSSPFDEWQFFQAQGLQQELAWALERLGRLESQAGRLAAAIEYARRWVALDPLHEPAQQLLIQLYLDAGQRPAARRQAEECVRLLDVELGAEPSPEIQELLALTRRPLPLAGGRGLAESPVAEPRFAPLRLPVPATPFLGRQDELAQIEKLFAQPHCRLITLTGPGGIGKTRTALEAAAHIGRSREHGACFVPLAPLGAADSIFPPIAGALGFAFFARGESSPQQQLLDFLDGKQLLLVMDNFEHLLAQAASLDEMLAAVPGLQLLVTSRERLGLRSEWVLGLEGMPVPDGDSSLPADQYFSVQLFIQCARRVAPDFAPDAGELACIARICRLVGGMPLGIEMAAAWTALLSCAEIAGEVDRSLDFLTTRMRDVPLRHQSLRAMFESSWRLLMADEQQVCGRLSVFRGGFGRQAAEQVAGASLPLLAALVDKSLLRRSASGRFEMLEVLRQYAAIKLAESSGAELETKAAHCRVYGALVAGCWPMLKGGGQMEALTLIELEIQNIRTGWRRAATIHDLRPYVDGLCLFYDMRSWFQEGWQAVTEAISHFDRPGLEPEEEILLAKLLAWQGRFAYRLGLFVEARECLSRSLAIVDRRQADEEHALVSCLAWGAGVLNEPDHPRQRLERARTFYVNQGDRWGEAICLGALGEMEWERGSRGTTEQYLREVLSIRREINDYRGTAAILLELGEFEHHCGRLADSQRYYSEAIELTVQVGDEWARQLSLDYAGYVTRRLGNLAEARRLHMESFAISRQIGDVLAVAGSLDNLGLVALDEGDLAAAQESFERGRALRSQKRADAQAALSDAHLAQVLMETGRSAEALELVRAGIATHRRENWQFSVSEELLLEGRILVELGDLALARERMRAALVLAMQNGQVAVQATILAGIAFLLQAEGRREQAERVADVVLNHPSADSAARRMAGRVLERVSELAEPPSVPTESDWEQVAREFLREGEDNA